MMILLCFLFGALIYVQFDAAGLPVWARVVDAVVAVLVGLAAIELGWRRGAKR